MYKNGNNEYLFSPVDKKTRISTFILSLGFHNNLNVNVSCIQIINNSNLANNEYDYMISNPI